MIFFLVLSCVFQILYGKHNFIYLYMCEWVWMGTCYTACVEVRRLFRVSCGHCFLPFFWENFLFFTAMYLLAGPWASGDFLVLLSIKPGCPEIMDMLYRIQLCVCGFWRFNSSPHACTASTLSTIHLPRIILWPEVMIYNFFWGSHTFFSGCDCFLDKMSVCSILPHW